MHACAYAVGVCSDKGDDRGDVEGVVKQRGGVEAGRVWLGMALEAKQVVINLKASA